MIIFYFVEFADKLTVGVSLGVILAGCCTNHIEIHSTDERIICEAQPL
jgi:hypothetical protein